MPSYSSSEEKHATHYLNFYYMLLKQAPIPATTWKHFST